MSLEFKFFGIPVRVHIWFLLSSLLLGGLFIGSRAPEGAMEHVRLMALWVAIVFHGVLFHELGHAFMGRVFGLRPRIELVAFGGLTAFQGHGPLRPPRAFLLSAAGPAVSVATGLVALAVWATLEPDPASVGGIALECVLFVNLAWGLLNLLPLLPLDGGQMMMSASEWIAPRRGRVFAAYASLGFAILFAAAMVALAQVFAALFAALFAWTSFQVLKREKEAVMNPLSDDPLKDAQEALRAGRSDRLMQLGGALLAQAEDDEERDRALHLLAWGHVLRGESRNAEAVLSAMSSEHGTDPALRGSLLLDLGKPDDALPYLEEALPRGGPFVRARMVRAIIEASRFEEAVELFDDEKGRDFPPIALEEIYKEAAARGPLDAAIGLAKALYRRVGDGLSALEVARCLARSERPEEGLNWLEKARIAGFGDLSAIEADPQLAPIRALPGWSEVREGFASPPA